MVGIPLKWRFPGTWRVCDLVHVQQISSYVTAGSSFNLTAEQVNVTVAARTLSGNSSSLIDSFFSVKPNLSPRLSSALCIFSKKARDWSVAQVGVAPAGTSVALK